MSVFDIEHKPTAGAQKNEDVGTLQEGKSQDSTPTQKPEAAVKTVETTGSDGQKEQAIVLDGPLSTIYTKALDILYSKKAINPALETQAMDVPMITEAVLQMEKDKISRLSDEKDVDYVYTTKGDDLSLDGLSDAFESIRVALEMKCFRSVNVVMESTGVDNKNISILSDYLRKNKVPLLYTRSCAMMKFGSK